jgi:hypothetical protein
MSWATSYSDSNKQYGWGNCYNSSNNIDFNGKIYNVDELFAELAKRKGKNFICKLTVSKIKTTKLKPI